MKLDYNLRQTIIYALGLFGVSCLVITFLFFNELTFVGLCIGVLTWFMLGLNLVFENTNTENF